MKQDPPSRVDEILHRAEQLAAAGHYDKAVDLLNGAGRVPRVLNAKGVCLLRLGRFDDAVRIFRELVSKPGCTWMRTGLPAVYKTNYATALLLDNHPAGCLEVLAELNDRKNPTDQRLRSAIKKWQSQLPFWQWLDWRIGRIESRNRPVAIDFEPGEVAGWLSPHDLPKPTTPPHPRAAA